MHANPSKPVSLGTDDILAQSSCLVLFQCLCNPRVNRRPEAPGYQYLPVPPTMTTIMPSARLIATIWRI
jgi:hypothetical protein